MPYTIKNLSGFPLDVPTLAGPAILPAHGELESVDLGALDVEVMRQSPYVEITEGEAKAPKPKKAAKKKAAPDPEVVRLRGEYTDLAGKKPFAGWKADRLQSEIDKLLAA